MAYEKVTKITIPEGSVLDAFVNAVRILPPCPGRDSFCIDFLLYEEEHDQAVLVYRVSVSQNFLEGLQHKLNQLMSVKVPQGYLLH